jgi:hypothetical protein
MWLFDSDSQIYVVLVGILLGVFVGGAWTASGRKEFLYVLGAIVGLTIAMLITERLIVTDRDALRATLNEIARDVQHNDAEGSWRDAQLRLHVVPGYQGSQDRRRCEYGTAFGNCRVQCPGGRDV